MIFALDPIHVRPFFIYLYIPSNFQLCQCFSQYYYPFYVDFFTILQNTFTLQFKEYGSWPAEQYKAIFKGTEQKVVSIYAENFICYWFIVCFSICFRKLSSAYENNLSFFGINEIRTKGDVKWGY